MFVSMPLKLRFKNVSTEAIVLYQKGLSIARTAVARTVEEFRKGKEPSVWVPTHITERTPVTGTDFIVIPPGEGRDLLLRSTALMSRLGVSIPGIAGGSGRWLLRVTLTTWPAGQRAARSWSARLKSRGRLWTQPLTVAPVAFEVPPSPKLQQCQ